METGEVIDTDTGMVVGTLETTRDFGYAAKEDIASKGKREEAIIRKALYASKRKEK